MISVFILRAFLDSEEYLWYCTKEMKELSPKGFLHEKPTGSARNEKKLYFAYRSFWPEIETMKKFRECGIDTFTFMVSNVTNSLGLPYTKYPPVWKWNGKYDLDAFDRQIGDILNAIPDARLMCLIDLNTPQWWTRYLGAFGVRYDSFYDLGKISASSTWRRDTTEYMQILLRHAEKNYADNLVAYMLGCGAATEWHDRSRGEESVYRLTAYRQWQVEHGMKPTDIPPRLARDAGSYDFDRSFFEPLSYFNGIDPTGCYDKLFPEGFGLMRTTEKNREAIDYWRFCNEYNADTAGFFLRKAREAVRGDVELGMFFGYAFGYWTMTSGHMDYERLLDSPDLDFVMAPISYLGRGMGRGSTSVTVGKTIALKNKRMLQEMDQRTYTSNHKLAEYVELPDPLKHRAEETEWKDATDSRELAKKFVMASDGIWKNDDEIAAGIKRETAFCLINGDSLWWFDMWGGFYKGEKVFAVLKQVKEIWDEQSSRPFADVSEILMVVDPDNMYFINDMDARSGTFQFGTVNALSLAGIPYSVCSFNDIEELEMSRFRLVIFCHPFELAERHMRVLKKNVLNDNRSVLWLYGPGIINNGKWDPGNVKTICGTEFGADGLGACHMEGWKSLYVHYPYTLTPEIIHQVAVDAGCHVYCSKIRPVFANSRLVAVHTGIAEILAVTFRKKYRSVVELFSGKEYSDTLCLEINSSGPDTFLFLCEEDPAG